MLVVACWVFAAASAAGDDEIPARPVSREKTPAAPITLQPSVEPTSPAPAADTGEPIRQPLVTADQFPGRQWVFYPGKKDTPIEATWTVLSEEGAPVLVCRGEPHGYLRTTSQYQEFELGLEWRFPYDEHGNSGVLMFTNGEDRIWPTSVQVQLHQPRTGSVFGSGGAMVEADLNAAQLTRPAHQWNELRIISRQGIVRVSINGKDVGDVKVVSPVGGAIGLQSEGSEVHFRNMWIRDLQPAAQALGPVGPMSYCPPICPGTYGYSWFAPAAGQFPAYRGMMSGSFAGYSAPHQFVYSPRDARHVASRNALAGRDRVLYPSRGDVVAWAPAGEWEVVGGRRAMRAARGGRGRH